MGPMAREENQGLLLLRGYGGNSADVLDFLRGNVDALIVRAREQLHAEVVRALCFSD
jgi:hypothetical protein